MRAKDIVVQEIARQAEFGMEPSWEDFVMAGIQARMKEVVEWVRSNVIFKYDNDREAWQAKLKEWEMDSEVKPVGKEPSGGREPR